MKHMNHNVTKNGAIIGCLNDKPIFTSVTLELPNVVLFTRTGILF